VNQDELIAEVVRICDQAEPPIRWISLVAVRKERCPHLEGWPDLFLIGSAGFCWREVKTGSTRLTAAQDDWLDAIEDAGGAADIWTERDLYDGSVRTELLALNGVVVGREPWIPEGASPDEAAHRRAVYGS
jgi:hypothetical protein